ncbi:MAG TPA: HAMP domain-containing sensor histidine kinase [Flavisolibacter sp.]|nr:HAMP domain-containing sensor histidine kinase [Flavisolibacter sp.]
MEIVYQKFQLLHEKIRSIDFKAIPETTLQFLIQLLERIRIFGFASNMDEYEKRKLGVFNQLNFFQLITGLLIPVLGMMSRVDVPLSAWLIACLPACTSAAVLFLTNLKKVEAALLTYFIAYPFFTCVVYLNGMNAGIELHFILYGILSVFFLQDIGYMLFTVAFSMVSYFILSVVLKDFIYEVELENKFLYLFNQGLSIVFIFYGLYLVKKENTDYQFRLLAKNRVLHKKNLEINKQKREIADKAKLLQSQKKELKKLNVVKNRLFSVISHDLKSPMYAMRTVFQNMHQYDIPAEEMKEMVPDIVNDLNYTIGLMENLLQWSKSQMQQDAVRGQELDLTELIHDVMNLLRLQAQAKNVRIQNKAISPIHVFADRDMINLVLRNLISNAIKFTPNDGQIAIGINQHSYFAEVYVQDTGMGISEEALQKINENNFYTTKGTASESGTGLGLMLCKEFLAKNGGQMHIESKLGKGSIFSFTLPLP